MYLDDVRRVEVGAQVRQGVKRVRLDGVLQRLLDVCLWDDTNPTRFPALPGPILSRQCLLQERAQGKGPAYQENHRHQGQYDRRSRHFARYPLRHSPEKMSHASLGLGCDARSGPSPRLLDNRGRLHLRAIGWRDRCWSPL